MGVTQGAGLSLQWLRNQLMPGQEYDALTQEAATADPGSQGLYWLPYLMGERTPHLDATARAAWVGLTAKHTARRSDPVGHRGRLLQPERRTRHHRRNGRESCIRSGSPEAEPAAHSGSKLMADVLNKKIATLESQEGSAYGAALLAVVGTGAYTSVEECCSVRHSGGRASAS